MKIMTIDKVMLDDGVDVGDYNNIHVQEAGRGQSGEDCDDQHRRRLHPRHQALVELIAKITSVG